MCLIKQIFKFESRDFFVKKSSYEFISGDLFLEEFL